MVQLQAVSKEYSTREGPVRALDGVDLRVGVGEFVVVRGPSGSGKTTLLLTAGGMLRPTQGRIVVAEEDVYRMSARDRARFRARNVGFVFQMYHLVPYLSVVENVWLPAAAGTRGASREDARAMVERFHLGGRENHVPAQLSAGERQRTAIARALLNRPQLVLADEPTGNLDEENAEQIHQHLTAFCAEGGTVIAVTHGSGADQYADRILQLREGRLLQ